jgi:hypothetical protein
MITVTSFDVMVGSSMGWMGVYVQLLARLTQSLTYRNKLSSRVSVDIQWRGG